MDADNIPITPLVLGNNVKKRRSFYVPSDASVLEENFENNTTTDLKYIKKIKIEENQWKQMYEERKENHKELMKKLNYNKTLAIDYNTMDQEDIEFLNGSFDLVSFIKRAEKLENMLKVAHLQSEHISKQKIMLMEKIENISAIFETEFCNKI